MVAKFADDTKLFRGIGLRNIYDELQMDIETN